MNWIKKIQSFITKVPIYTWLANIIFGSQASDNKSRAMKNTTTQKVQQQKVEPSVVDQIKRPKIEPTRVIEDPGKERSGNAFLYTSAISDTFQKSLARTMIRGGIDPQEALNLLDNSNYSFEDLKEYLLKHVRDPKEFFYKLNTETGKYEFDYDTYNRAQEIKTAIQGYNEFRLANPKEAEEIRTRQIINEVNRMKAESTAKRLEQEARDLELEIERTKIKQSKKSEKDIEKLRNDENDWLNQLAKSKNTNNVIEDVNTEILGTQELSDLFNE